jgi:electron transport complex protein RnfB
MTKPLTPPSVAVIDEQRCIGCALCLPACPVDAIVGAAKYLHTVIAEECIGCRLCLPPCPVNCIAMVETGRTLSREERRKRAARAKRRYLARLARLRRLNEGGAASPAAPDKRETIERAMRHARERLLSRS